MTAKNVTDARVSIPFLFGGRRMPVVQNDDDSLKAASSPSERSGDVVGSCRAVCLQPVALEPKLAIAKRGCANIMWT